MTYPVPKIAIMVRKPPVEKMAMPLSAAPLVQPRPSCEPIPNKMPPANAKKSLVRIFILGPLSTFNLSRPDKNPDKKAPVSKPSTSKTSHERIGEIGLKYSAKNDDA